MLSIEWDAESGWDTPRIVPYQNLSLDPSACVLHYAFECFEGMKAYKDSNGQIRLFRPNKNMERLNKSSSRIALPTVDGEALTKLIGELVKLDSRFIPKFVETLAHRSEKPWLTGIQLPRIFVVPPSHDDWHAEHPWSWSPGLCPSVCDC